MIESGESMHSVNGAWLMGGAARKAFVLRSATGPSVAAAVAGEAVSRVRRSVRRVRLLPAGTSGGPQVRGLL